MRANRVYRLTVARQGSRFFRDAGAVDSVEVVDIATNEAVLFWDVPAADARRFTGALKAELAQADAEDFIARWSAVEDPADL